MMIAAILGASFVVLLSAFAVSNPWLFGLDTGVDLSNIGVFNQHYMLDGELKMVKEDIGADFEAYRNHCLRVLTFTQFFIPPSVFEVYPNAMNIVSMALAFHDVALWTDGALDYIDPSVAQMELHVRKEGIWDQEQIDIAKEIILWHHKVTPYNGGSSEAINDIVNAVRKADWADASWGVIRWNLPAPLFEAAYQKIPEAGFHMILAGMGARLSPDSYLGQLAPLKIFKW